MVKLDLHTHSIISPDGAGSITAMDFEQLLAKGVLDCIAITDHNETSFARQLQQKHGDKIIVGEEIMTSDGEMIGLFLTQTIAPQLSAEETIKAIKKQNGLVYIPHPFETLRKGLQEEVLRKIAFDIDIFEVFNGRGRMRGKAKQAEEFARRFDLLGAASSDAHGFYGIGKTYTEVEKIPTRETLVKLLKNGTLQKRYAPLFSYLYPALNVIKKKVFLRK